MYFSIGSHEGYYCPEGVEAYDVILPAPETLDASELDGPLLGKDERRIIENSDRIHLKYEYFTVDALIFKNMRARSVVLKNRINGRGVRVSFPDRNYFLIWTKPGAPYVCLEPLCGILDSVSTDKNFKTKEGIETVAPGKHFVTEHTIEILEQERKI